MTQGNMHVIAVQDLLAKAAFLRDALGFDVIEIDDDGWRLLQPDSCRIMAGQELDG